VALHGPPLSQRFVCQAVRTSRTTVDFSGDPSAPFASDIHTGFSAMA
jgi:hypothetical protein